jgi:hypothetical protein
MQIEQSLYQNQFKISEEIELYTIFVWLRQNEIDVSVVSFGSYYVIQFKNLEDAAFFKLAWC